MKKFLLIIVLLVMLCDASAQRQYAKESVLSAGQWVKIAADKPGVYKIDAAMLLNMGFVGKTNSNGIRLFGNGGEVLPESNEAIFSDDLIENAITVVDGGDGIFDGNDYLLFYATGPNHWKFDSLASTFNYSKNIYAESSYYFLTTGSTQGKRIATARAPSSSNINVDEFDEHIHHELDSINFLKSGKEWYGEEFNVQAGVTQKNFNYTFNGLYKPRSFSIYSEVIGRSAGNPNKINVIVNGQPLLEHTTDPLIGTLIEQVANVSKLKGSGMFNANKLEIGYRFNPGSVNAKAWLNYFDLFFRRPLDMQGLSQLAFRDIFSVAKSSVASFNIKNPGQSITVWQITLGNEPASIKLNLSNEGASFIASAETLHEYIAFSPSALMVPKIIEKVKNQNLHALPKTDFVIITHGTLIGQAERLSAFHQSHDKLKTTVVDVRQIYNEFSSGSPDPTAIRNFVKMFYDRAGSDLTKRPRYLLLFGGAS